ncbi:plant root hair defective 3 protein [Kipferlia bialata]|uniref:Plant root hair defective 3 protein n=1 Tax=Kipferlia bialata TaxID=797122 RepID=A0A9K3D9Y1_9EUKA|nr:plant root hair defective 3 protein [Kipferlia bialata]|eukprot:g12731.t1
MVDSLFLQVIDKDCNFSPALSDALAATDDLDEYHLLAVLGCQSSGKSTLLNRLFKTEFQVMNTQAGRHQTTLGVWGARYRE